MDQQRKPLQEPIIGANKISDESNLSKLTCVDIFSMIMNFIFRIFIILIIIAEMRIKEIKGRKKK